MYLRINKYIAQYLPTSRRKADILIAEGKVAVNGKTATTGMLLDTTKDNMQVGSKPVICTDSDKVYLALNKPTGVLSSVGDPHDRKTVVDLIKTHQRVFPIGRLDYYSHGLILLTNDGDFANLVAHPRYQIPKVYEVTIRNPVTPKALTQLREGCMIENSRSRPAKVIWSAKTPTKLRMSVSEGKNHEIKKLCGAAGLWVTDLIRVSVGNIKLGELREGTFRHLTPAEVATLKDMASHDQNSGQDQGIPHKQVL